MNYEPPPDPSKVDWKIDRPSPAFLKPVADHERRGGKPVGAGTTVIARPDTEAGRYRWTVDAFGRAVDAGVFDEPKRLELVNGQLWEREAMNPPHADLTEDIANLLRGLLGPQFRVREEKPFHIAGDGEPVPDVYVADVNAPRDRDSHPLADQVRLVIEVADSSASRDTGEKATLYAQAGIADYWVSLINEAELRVHRNPTPSGYLAPDTLHLRAGDTIAPLCAPGVSIAVADLLPRHEGA